MRDLIGESLLSASKMLYRCCLHGGGGPQVSEVSRGGAAHLSCKRDQIKMRDYVDGRVTPPKRVTSPTMGPLPQCNQAFRQLILECDLSPRSRERVKVHLF